MNDLTVGCMIGTFILMLRDRMTDNEIKRALSQKNLDGIFNILDANGHERKPEAL